MYLGMLLNSNLESFLPFMLHNISALLPVSVSWFCFMKQFLPHLFWEFLSLSLWWTSSEIEYLIFLKVCFIYLFLSVTCMWKTWHSKETKLKQKCFWRIMTDAVWKNEKGLAKWLPPPLQPWLAPSTALPVALWPCGPLAHVGSGQLLPLAAPSHLAVACHLWCCHAIYDTRIWVPLLYIIRLLNQEVLGSTSCSAINRLKVTQ